MANFLELQEKIIMESENIENYVMESTDSINKILDKLKKIKKEKPDVYSDSKDVKKFIDDYYDELIKIADILEKEPEKLRKSEIKTLGVTVVGLIGVMILPMEAGFAGIGISLVVWGITVLNLVISSIIQYMRISKDTSAINELSKIRSALKKVNHNKLPDEYRKKILKLINSIDDAETEFSSRMKFTKESVVSSTKINIFESYYNGVISHEECEFLLESVSDKKNRKRN